MTVNIYQIWASIAGVTYMDHFDFEERYRNINECNPLHWHPLHLPKKCTDMFEQAIRSRIAKYRPYRLVTRVEPPTINFYSPEISLPLSFGYLQQFQLPPPSQWQILMDLLRLDVFESPSAPKMEMVPNVGLVASYHQPVSYKTAKMINKMSQAYADFYPYVPEQENNTLYQIHRQIKKMGKKKKYKALAVVDKN